MGPPAWAPDDAISLDEPEVAALRGHGQDAVGVAIHAAPRSDQGYSGGDLAVRRMLQTLKAAFSRSHA
jgi:hypothetical protein